MDFQKALGAHDAATLQRFGLYMADSDRHGAPVPDIEAWTEAALTIMAQINGGATRLPVAQGAWNPGGDAPLVRENTYVVFSFIRDAAAFEANIGRLAAFIHSYGKQTGQGEVMVEFSGEQAAPDTGASRFVNRAYFIDDYVLAAPMA